MGLFFSSDRFTRPGPGVRPDAPRKKGVARLAEIMGRDMWNFFRAGFLAFLGCLPFIIGMFFAVETHALLFMLLAGIIGGLIAGPELSAMADTVLRSLRDEPGYWWETYRRVWKRNARESLAWTHLTSPGEGVITAVSASPGQVVSAGQVAIRLARAGQREALVQLPETLRPAIGSEALAAGVLSRYELSRYYRPILPNIYADKRSALSLRQRSTAAWLWSGRDGVIAGMAASALHKAKWVADDEIGRAHV